MMLAKNELPLFERPAAATDQYIVKHFTFKQMICFPKMLFILLHI